MPVKENKGLKTAKTKEKKQESCLDTIMEDKNDPPDKTRGSGEDRYGKNEDPQKNMRKRTRQINQHTIRIKDVWMSIKENKGLKAADREQESSERQEKSEEMNDICQEVVGSRRGTTKKNKLDGQKRQESPEGTKSFLDTVMEENGKSEENKGEREDRHTMRVTKEENNPPEKIRQKPPEEGKMKTPRRHVEKLNRRAAKSRREWAIYVVNIAKDPRDKNREMTTVRSKTKRVTFGTRRGREDGRTRRATEEKNDPPDKNDEEMKKKTGQGGTKLDLSREGNKKKSAKTDVKEQRTTKETEDRNDPPDKSRRNSGQSHERNEDPQKQTRRKRWQPNQCRIRIRDVSDNTRENATVRKRSTTENKKRKKQPIGLRANRKEFLDEKRPRMLQKETTRGGEDTRQENEEGPQKYTRRRKQQPKGENNDGSGRNIGTKQQVGTRSHSTDRFVSVPKKL